MASKEALGLYETILKSGDLTAEVKLHSRISGRLALYLVMALEHSIQNDDPKNHLNQVLSDEDKTALHTLVGDVLAAGKLQTFYEILRKFGAAG